MKTLLRNSSIGSLAAFLVLAVGCSDQNSFKPEPEQTNPNQAAITTNVGEQVAMSDKWSRITVDDAANTTKFSNGDKIGVYLVEYNISNTTQTNLQNSGNQTDNHLYTYNGSNWTANNLTNPLTWRKYNAFAYHPYQASVSNASAIKHTVRTDQSSGILATDYLMWADRSAAITPIKGEKFSLNFKHKLTRLIVNVSLPSTYNGATISGISSVSTVAFPKGTALNLSSGVTTPEGTKGEVKMYRFDGSTATSRTGKFEAVVVPTTVAAGLPVVRIDYTTSTPTNGTGSLYYYAPTGGVTFADNQIYTLTLNADELSFLPELTAFVAKDAVAQKTTVTASNSTLNWSIKVKQKGAATDWNWISISLNGTSYTSDGSPISGTGTKEIHVKVSENKTGIARIGSLILSANGYPDRELVVVQK